MEKSEIINKLTVSYFKVHIAKIIMSNIAIWKTKNWQHSHNVSKEV